MRDREPGLTDPAAGSPADPSADHAAGDPGAPSGQGPPPADRADYLARWSALHGGVETRGLVGGWLAAMHALGRPLARARIAPDAVTAGGLLLAVLVLVPAAAGDRWLLLAVAVVVLSAVLDGVDGTVAILSGRTTRWGYVLDSVCDRVADACYLTALWLAGAPGPLCAAAGTVVLLLEYLRARAAAAGMSEVGVITVAERPTRVIITAMFLLGAGLYPSAAGEWAAAGASATLTLGLVGVAQLVRVVRRRLG